MFYLVGSRALEHYGVNLGHKPGDYDIYSDYTYKVDIDRHITKIKDTEKGSIHKLIHNDSIIFDIFNKNLWDTDKLFFSIQGETKGIQFENNAYIYVTIAPKEILYIMYKTTAEVYKDEKSVKDFEIVKKAWPDLIFRHELYQQRLKETQDYYDKTKKQFFEQHGLKQYIDHDKLHEMVTEAYSSALRPVYKDILDSKNSTKIDIEKFKNLNIHSKERLLAEEICVLLFERFFIYKTVKDGFQDKYVKQFFSNSKQSVTTKLISHVCEKGLKGEHPEIIEFGRKNIKKVTNLVYAYKERLKKPLPKWFLEDLEKARVKYLIIDSIDTQELEKVAEDIIVYGKAQFKIEDDEIPF